MHSIEKKSDGVSLMGEESKGITFNILNYFFIIFMIYQSGNIFFLGDLYNVAVPILFISSLIVILSFIYAGKIKLVFDKSRIKQISFILLFTLSMLLTILINMDYHFNPYIAIFLQIMVAFFLTYVISFNSFVDKYTKVMFTLALVSLVFFLIQQIYPAIVYNFKFIEGPNTADYYNAYIHVFLSAKDYSDLYLLSRNSGIFWEPGAYQAFLNLALFLYLIKASKVNIYVLLTFIITIITTFSTNGYIILILILLSFSRKIFISNKITGFLLLITITLSSLYILNNSASLIDSFFFAFNKLFMEGRIYERISLGDLNYLFVDNRINLFGISFSTFESFGVPLWNSIIHTTIVLGLPFTFMLIYGYFNFTRKVTSKWVVFFLILLMFFSTETLFWRPLFLYLIFIGMLEINKKV